MSISFIFPYSQENPIIADKGHENRYTHLSIKLTHIFIFKDSKDIVFDFLCYFDFNIQDIYSTNLLAKTPPPPN